MPSSMAHCTDLYSDNTGLNQKQYIIEIQAHVMPGEVSWVCGAEPKTIYY